MKKEYKVWMWLIVIAYLAWAYVSPVYSIKIHTPETVRRPGDKRPFEPEEFGMAPGDKRILLPAYLVKSWGFPWNIIKDDQYFCLGFDPGYQHWFVVNPNTNKPEMRFPGYDDVRAKDRN